jgi:hypothetical protein
MHVSDVVTGLSMGQVPYLLDFVVHPKRCTASVRKAIEGNQFNVKEKHDFFSDLTSSSLYV